MRSALIRFLLARPRLDALVISRDLDWQHHKERRVILEAWEKQMVDADILFCLATPLPMREVWLLNGFNPRTPAERAALKREKRVSGLIPVRRRTG